MASPADIVNILSNLSAIPAIASGLRVKGILWWYACLSFAADIAGFTLKQLHISRFLISNLFIVCEFILIATFLMQAFLQGRPRRRSFLGIGVVAVCFVGHTLTRSPEEGNYVAGALLYGLFVVMCMLGLYKVIQEIEHVKIERSQLFIFCSGFLLYASGSIMILLFKRQLNISKQVADHALLEQLWIVRNVLNILKNLAIARVFILRKTESSIV